MIICRGPKKADLGLAEVVDQFPEAKIVKHPYKRLWAVCINSDEKNHAVYYMDGGQ